MQSNRKTLKIKNSFYIILWIFSLSLVLSSCSPKKQGVRVTNKTNQVQLNPGTSAIAQQQASTLNANYSIYSVGFPELTDSTYIVNSEIQDPSQKFIPITTKHENGQTDSEGIYTDSITGIQVYVNARCSSDDCSRYYLLVTAVKNNQAIYQSGAVSFKEDCSFYSISTKDSMYKNIDSFEKNMFNLQPIGDSSTCFE